MSAISMQQATPEALLCQPATYPERPDVVETIETHISQVFLTNRFAYKLKKPVQFAFVDFSTPDKRRRACENEVRINRRLGGNVYLDVVPITRANDQELTLNGSGDPVDWVVKMRRLPETRSLQHLILTDQLLPREIESLAAMLSSFYLRQPPLTIQPGVYRARIADHVRSNTADLLDHFPDLTQTIHRLHCAAMNYLTLRPASFDRRVCDGRIVDGHGDLRPEHIYFVSPPVVIDGIEFSDELREVDIADELSFLAMECDRLGKPEVGSRMLQHYADTTGDEPEPSVIAFYKTYRACVRAKINVLSANRATRAARPNHFYAAKEYLQLASSYLPQVGPQFLIAVTGLMGTGKSTLAQRLAHSLGGELLQTDQVRQEMFGTNQTSGSYGEGKYQSKHRADVYGELLERCRQLLQSGASVILDGAFLDASQRSAVEQLAEASSVASLIVQCRCPREVAIQRLRFRTPNGAHHSEAGPSLYDHQVAEFADELRAIEQDTTLHVDTRQPLDEQESFVVERLKTLCNA